MKRIAALTQGMSRPSSRFRVRQHFDWLRGLDFDIIEYCPKNIETLKLLRSFGSGRLRRNPQLYPFYALDLVGNLVTRIPGAWSARNAQITWLSRGLYPGFPSFESLLSAPIVLDVDDAVWLNRPFGKIETNHCARQATAVVAGNAYLANYYESLNKRVHVVPTAVDTDRYSPGRHSHGGVFTIGWIGTSGNFPYLYMIEAALHEFLSKRSDARLLIVAEERPRFTVLAPSEYQFSQWTEESEVERLRSMDVGIMPLEDSEWSRGKCSFKMLQYMSCGIPVIVSPVGMNGDVLEESASGLGVQTTGEWYEAFEFLYLNREAASVFGCRGRKAVLKKYDARIVAEQLGAVFDSVL